MSVPSTAAETGAFDLLGLSRLGDRVLYFTLFASAIASLAIGQQFGDLKSALGCSAALLVLGSAAFFAAPGTRIAAFGLTACNAAFVALHIQLGRGTIEFHFGVFVLLGLLMVYRDWRPIVFAAALFAVHHVVFDRLQALNLGVYCTPEANLSKTLMHATYVVVQTGVEIFLTLGLRRAAIEVAELSALLRHVDRGELLCLDVAAAPVSAPTAARLKDVLLKIEAAMADVSGAALSIAQASAELAAGNLDLSQRTEAQVGSLQTTAASMEQLTGTVKSTADTAGQADSLAGSASAAAVAGGKAVGAVVATMADISRSSKRIADITAVIDGIAFQTNILALNAAVEAARAGEQGRGFSVVAAEVRSLAKRSAEAAKEIKTLIGDSVEKVDAGASLVNAAGARMEDIVAQARRVSDLIGEISSAASEQTGGIAQVSHAVTQLDQVAQRNAALVEESAASAQSLRDQVTQLNAVVGRFELAPRRAAPRAG